MGCGEEVDDLNLTVCAICSMQNVKSQFHYVKIESVVSAFVMVTWKNMAV